MIGVLVSGEGTNLQALVDAGLPVVAVASNRWGAPALARAEREGIPAAVFDLDRYHSREARDLAMAAWLAERGVELVVCAGYMHLLTRPFLARFPALNVHPSLLPAFPGMHAVRDALSAGVAETGVTVHFLDEGVDTGPVVAQEPVAVHPRDTVETLGARIHAVEHRLLPSATRRCLATRSTLSPENLTPPARDG
ncbi:MAG: phosphoribosylglycinamide formyltransferase [Thermoleophilia bacterium]|nr:phosphoribosylglycinamide formyltransferase [Thermoleophilia bacterium]